MFRRSMWRAESAVEVEPYIDSVNISRSISGRITIQIEERTASYMLYLRRNVWVY